VLIKHRRRDEELEKAEIVDTLKEEVLSLSMKPNLLFLELSEIFPELKCAAFIVSIFFNSLLEVIWVDSSSGQEELLTN